jgi:hypothetical protein
MPNIHVGPHLKDLYCGPAALCAVTDMPPSVIAQLVNECRREPVNTKIRGMHASEISYVLDRCGVRFTKMLVEPRGESLRDYAEKVDPTTPQIVLVTKHFVALYDGFVYDQHVPMGRLPGLHHSKRKWVRVAWVIGT